MVAVLGGWVGGSGIGPCARCACDFICVFVVTVGAFFFFFFFFFFFLWVNLFVCGIMTSFACVHSIATGCTLRPTGSLKRSSKSLTGACR